MNTPSYKISIYTIFMLVCFLSKSQFFKLKDLLSVNREVNRWLMCAPHFRSDMWLKILNEYVRLQHIYYIYTTYSHILCTKWHRSSLTTFHEERKTQRYKWCSQMSFLYTYRKHDGQLFQMVINNQSKSHYHFTWHFCCSALQQDLVH